MPKKDSALRELLPHLEATQLPFEVKHGGRHRKIILGGALVATIPRAGNDQHYCARGLKNVIARIKRVGRQQDKTRLSSAIQK